jgi:hypothetical protein
MPSPLFTGISAMMQHLPFVKHALSRNCVATWARGGTPGAIYRAARACGGKSAPRAHRHWKCQAERRHRRDTSVDYTDHLRPMSQPLLTDKATTAGTKLDQAALKLAALDLEVATQSLFVAGQQRQYAEPCRGSARFHRRRPGGCGAAGRVAAIEQA